MHDTSEYLDWRDATPADQDFLNVLYRGTRDDLTQLGDDATIAALISMQQKIHHDGQCNQYPDARHLLLWQEGKAVARMVLDANAQRFYLVDITVLSGARNAGIGSTMLKWAQRQAAATGLPLELQVHGYNVRAYNLYLALGFVDIASNEVSRYMRWQARA